MRIAPLLAALLLAPLAGAPGTQDVVVHVRIEGAWAHVWEGEVRLGPTFTLQASSGKVHTLPGPTPLQALVEAARIAGLDLEVSDAYSDFVVRSVEGEAWYDTRWWDYRVDWIEPNYGAQAQWLAWGPPLQQGSAVLWYVDTFGTTPLRLTPRAAAPGPPCLHVAQVESLAVEVVHNPGQPWPPALWRPVPLARLAGAVPGIVVGGVGTGFAQAEGPYWADEQALPLTPLVHYVRSPRAIADC
jgi:hypothetical protein